MVATAPVHAIPQANYLVTDLSVLQCNEHSKLTRALLTPLLDLQLLFTMSTPRPIHIKAWTCQHVQIRFTD